MNITFEEIEYFIEIRNVSFFSVFLKKEEGFIYSEDNELFSGKINSEGVFDLKIKRIDYANREFILYVNDILKDYFNSTIEQTKEEEAIWNKKTKEENKQIKDDVNSSVAKIFKLLKSKKSTTLNDLTNIFFNTLVDNITDEDIKRELAFLRNKVQIVVNQINNQIK